MNRFLPLALFAVIAVGCGQPAPPAPAPQPDPQPQPGGPVVPVIPLPPSTGAKPIQPKPPEPPSEPVGTPAPDFPLDPETEYKDFPPEFVAAVAKANGKVTWTARQPNGTWQYVYAPVEPRPKTALPLVRFDFSDTTNKPDPAALPECPVPFGVLVDEYKDGLAAALKPLAAQPNLELLHTRGAVKAEAFEPLGKLPKLTRLMLENVTDDDGPAAVLKLFPKLTDFGMNYGEKAGPKTFAAVATLTGLRHLYLNGCEALTDAEVAALAPLKELRTFSRVLFGQGSLRNKLTPKVAEAVAKFDQLERIDLHGGPVFGRKIAQLSRLTRLRRLAVDGTGSPHPLAHADADLRVLAKLPHLADLDLGQVEGISPDGWKALDAAPELKHVHVRERVAGIASFTRLEELTVQDWFKVNADDVAALAAMPNLKRLRFQGQSNMGDKELAVFCEAGRLEELTLYNGKLTDAAFEKAASLKGLKRLLLAPPEGKFTDAALDRLAGVSSLEVLELHGFAADRFTLAGLRKLTALKNLKRLVVRRGLAYLGEEAKWKAALEELRKGLPGCEVMASQF